MEKKFRSKALKFLGLLIIVIGFLVITIGTSNWYERIISKTIKQNGQKVYGTIEYLDCKSNNFAIFNIEGNHVRINLKDKCSHYNVGDNLLFYGYNKKYILSEYRISNIKIILPIILGIIIMLVGIYMIRRMIRASQP